MRAVTWVFLTQGLQVQRLQPGRPTAEVISILSYTLGAFLAIEDPIPRSSLREHAEIEN
jgi:hypothetical protein